MQRAGTYSVASIQARSWLQLPIQLDSKVKKAKNSKSTLYEIFVKYSEIEEDPFWRELLLDASKGKFPKNFSYKDGTIYFRVRNKSMSQILPESPIEGEYAFKKFLREKGGFVSEREHIQQNSDVSDISLTSEETPNKESLQWSKLNPRRLRTTHLDRFIINFISKNKLNPQEAKKLKIFINLATILDILKDDIVIMDEYRIVEIKNLYYNSKTKEVRFEPLEKAHNFQSKRPASKSKSGVSGYIKLWVKYLDTYKIKEIPKPINRVIINIKKIPD